MIFDAVVVYMAKIPDCDEHFVVFNQALVSFLDMFSVLCSCHFVLSVH